MRSAVDRFLKAYDTMGIVIRLKARFLLNLFIGIIVLIFFAVAYTSILHLNNPLYDYSINLKIVVPELLVIPLMFVALYFLKKGRFSRVGHTVLIVSMALLWLVMFLDRAALVSRLDTIAVLIALVAMTPLVIERKKYVILIYAGINLAILYVFAFYYRNDWDLPVNSFVDYLLDNTIALAVITIVAYNLFSINQKSLEKMEEELAERARAEEDLRVSHSHLNSLMNSTSDFILISDENAMPVAFNRSYGEVMKYIFGFEMKPGIQPHKFQEDEEAIRYWDDMHCRVLSGEKFSETFSYEFPDGATRYFNVLFNPIVNDEGDVAGFSEITRDITDIMEAEEQLKASLTEKEILLKELYHRTKNNMQVISSFIALQDSYLNDENLSDIFRDINLRIESIAMVHQKLYSSRSLSRIELNEYIHDLIQLVMEGYDVSENGVTTETDIIRESISIDMAIPCGLILNELLTNSLKYAFTGNGGTIIIQISKTPEETYVINYSDDGDGLPEGASIMEMKKLGISIIVNIVKHQLRGSVEFSGENGFSCRIAFDPALFRDRV